jgi:hypothetical protein
MSEGLKDSESERPTPANKRAPKTITRPTQPYSPIAISKLF